MASTVTKGFLTSKVKQKGPLASLVFNQRSSSVNRPASKSFAAASTFLGKPRHSHQEEGAPALSVLSPRSFAGMNTYSPTAAANSSF